MTLMAAPIAERALAAAAGVSRVGDLTGLDRLGVPVWQAVRPLSRSLSTHQGKSFDPLLARLGAVMEGMECDAAERWEGPRVRSSWDTLHPGLRAPAADDFADRRGSFAATTAIDWTLAEPLGESRPFLVPAEQVSLDCTRRPLAGLGRSSSGQGARFDLDGATLKGLLELIERDAETEFLNGSIHARGLYRVAPPDRLPDAVRALLERCADLGIELRFHMPPALGGTTMVVCEMLERRARDMLHAFALGSAAALDPLEAFCGALLEAAQSRVTGISGARDDLPLKPIRRIRMGLAPLPALRPPAAFPPARAVPAPAAAIAHIVETLAEEGFAQAGRVRLPAAHPGVHVVKCWVPGLGLNDRRRRNRGRLQ